MLSKDTGDSENKYDAVAESLNKLRDDVNKAFGVHETAPRVNMGACGPFAAKFFEIWNRLFASPCRICFLVETENPDLCHHIIVQLPDGRFFDGGYGVFTPAEAEVEIAKRAGTGRVTIIVMDQYDEDLFDRYSAGRIKSGTPVGSRCPDYSDASAGALIERRLQELADEDQDHLMPRFRSA